MSSLKNFDIDLLEKFLDAFGAHHGDELAGGLGILFELPLALVGDHFALRKIGDFARIDHDVGFEIEHALEFTQRDVEQVADARRQSLEEPDMRAGAGQFDMAEAFAAHTRQRHFDAALVADHAAMLHPLVLAAETFPVRHGSEDPRAEQAVAFRFERAVIDGFRLGDFAVAPASDLLRRSQRDPDRVEIRGYICPIVGRGSHLFS